MIAYQYGTIIGEFLSVDLSNWTNQVNWTKWTKYQGVKEFHMLAHMQ